jgi:hypothetical protein
MTKSLPSPFEIETPPGAEGRSASCQTEREG